MRLPYPWHGALVDSSPRGCNTRAVPYQRYYPSWPLRCARKSSGLPPVCIHVSAYPRLWTFADHPIRLHPLVPPILQVFACSVQYSWDWDEQTRFAVDDTPLIPQGTSRTTTDYLQIRANKGNVWSLQLNPKGNGLSRTSDICTTCCLSCDVLPVGSDRWSDLACSNSESSYQMAYSAIKPHAPYGQNWNCLY